MTWLRMRWRQAMKVAGIAAVAYAVVAGAATVRAVDGGRNRSRAQPMVGAVVPAERRCVQ